MAKKYIDADRLKELLDAKYKEFTEKAKKDCLLQYQYMADGLDIAEQFIDSLQQKQPEVDLVTEYDEQFYSDPVYGKLVNRNAGIAVARYFYELGLKAREKNK